MRCSRDQGRSKLRDEGHRRARARRGGTATTPADPPAWDCRRLHGLSADNVLLRGASPYAYQKCGNNKAGRTSGDTGTPTEEAAASGATRVIECGTLKSGRFMRRCEADRQGDEAPLHYRRRLADTQHQPRPNQSHLRLPSSSGLQRVVGLVAVLKSSEQTRTQSRPREFSTA